MNLRLATLADAETLMALINRAFQVERFFIDADRIGLAEILERLGSGIVLVLEELGVTIACVYLEIRGDRAYLGLLSVEPSVQGQGLGSWIMDGAEEHCRVAGCRHIDLRVVNLREELPPFYHGRGYVETGTSPFPANQPVKRPCHFVEMSKAL